MSEEIIDGIDVSECKYLNKVVNEEPYCNIDEEHLYTCSSDENCYYKQLKRLQAENYELKESLKVFQSPDIKKVLTLYRTGEIERIEQENEKLKKEFKEEHAELLMSRAENERLKESIAQLKEKYNTLIYKKESREEAFCKQNKELYEEKNCLHKIIDRLLENSGYSKDIASAEDFEDVYEDMQIKRNELEKYRKALEEIRNYVNAQLDGFGNDVYGITKNQITTITNKINEVLK